MSFCHQNKNKNKNKWTRLEIVFCVIHNLESSKSPKQKRTSQTSKPSQYNRIALHCIPVCMAHKVYDYLKTRKHSHQFARIFRDCHRISQKWCERVLFFSNKIVFLLFICVSFGSFFHVLLFSFSPIVLRCTLRYILLRAHAKSIHLIGFFSRNHVCATIWVHFCGDLMAQAWVFESIYLRTGMCVCLMHMKRKNTEKSSNNWIIDWIA